MRNETNICLVCDFFQPRPTDEGMTDMELSYQGKTGTCHRHPPAEAYAWPPVREVDWCGEFTHK